VTVRVGGERVELTRAAAVALRERLGAAAAGRREFAHTTGEHRPDGSYVVERTGAASSGHRKVFDSFGAVRDLAAALPREATAEDVDREGVSGGRRHLLLWHLVEHPALDPELVARQPLTVRTAPGANPEADDGAGGDAPEVVGDD